MDHKDVSIDVTTPYMITNEFVVIEEEVSTSSQD